MTCEHIRRANGLIDNANSELNWSDDMSPGDAIGGLLTLNAWGGARLGQNLEEAQRRMRNARNYMRQAQQILRECNCSFTLTVNNVDYSPERMVRFVSGAMSEVAGRLGGSSQVEMQRDKIIVRYIPPSRQLPWWMS